MYRPTQKRWIGLSADLAASLIFIGATVAVVAIAAILNAFGTWG
jgi:hypothetical protein